MEKRERASKEKRERVDMKEGKRKGRESWRKDKRQELVRARGGRSRQGVEKKRRRRT